MLRNSTQPVNARQRLHELARARERGDVSATLTTPSTAVRPSILSSRILWPRWIALGIICLVLFVIDAIFVESPRFDVKDMHLHDRFLMYAADLHSTKLLRLITLNSVGKHGEYFSLEIGCFVVLIGGWLVLRNKISSALVLVVAVLGALSLDVLLKDLIVRPGPLADVNSDGLRTFPSGHTAVGVSLFMAGAYLMSREVSHRTRPKVLIAGAFACLAIVMSAMTFHLPSEVVGGILLSGVWLAFLLPVSKFLIRPSSPRREVTSQGRAREILPRHEDR